MAVLTTEARKRIPTGKFGLSGRRFPLEDAAHQRNAIPRATQSYNKGNISLVEKNRVQSRARNLLGIKAPQKSNDDYHSAGGPWGMKSFMPAHNDMRKHALSMASAKHLHSEGHMSQDHHDAIMRVAAKGMGKAGVGKEDFPVGRKPAAPAQMVPEREPKGKPMFGAIGRKAGVGRMPPGQQATAGKGYW